MLYPMYFFIFPIYHVMLIYIDIHTYFPYSFMLSVSVSCVCACVLLGEEPAAMQHASGSLVTPILSVVLFAVIAAVFAEMVCQR